MGVLTIKQAEFPALQVCCHDGLVHSISWQQSLSDSALRHVEGRGDEKSQLQRWMDDLEAYFAGQQILFDWPLDFNQGTAFQRQVWKTLLSVPYGCTRSYEWVAYQVGRPKASRAVGGANCANPFSLLVPCHRIIHKDGQIGGYAKGVAIKKMLLALEGSLSDR